MWYISLHGSTTVNGALYEAFIYICYMCILILQFTYIVEFVKLLKMQSKRKSTEK